MRIIKALVAVAFVSSLAACNPQMKSIAMTEQNQSGQRGTVTLTEVGQNKVRVEINLSMGNDTGAQKAHIHNGTCAQLGTVVHNLTDVQSGKSTTEVEVNYDTLVKAGTGKYAVNVHKSTDPSVYVACGNL